MTVEAEGVSKAHRELDARTAELRLAAEKFPELTTFERAESRRRILRSLRARRSSRSRGWMSCPSTRTCWSGLGTRWSPPR
jgi:hypothetical protein